MYTNFTCIYGRFLKWGFPQIIHCHGDVPLQAIHVGDPTSGTLPRLDGNEAIRVRVKVDAVDNLGSLPQFSSPHG